MTQLLEPVELRARGFAVLVDALGWTNAVRYVQQFEQSRLNYTVERQTILPNWNAAEMMQQMRGTK